MTRSMTDKERQERDSMKYRSADCYAEISGKAAELAIDTLSHVDEDPPSGCEVAALGMNLDATIFNVMVDVTLLVEEVVKAQGRTNELLADLSEEIGKARVTMDSILDLEDLAGSLPPDIEDII